MDGLFGMKNDTIDPDDADLGPTDKRERSSEVGCCTTKQENQCCYGYKDTKISSKPFDSDHSRHTKKGGRTSYSLPP
jgi:hypothetical protein